MLHSHYICTGSSSWRHEFVQNEVFFFLGSHVTSKLRLKSCSILCLLLEFSRYLVAEAGRDDGNAWMKSEYEAVQDVNVFSDLS